MSVGKDLVNSVIGNTESAVIKIHDYRNAASVPTVPNRNALNVDDISAILKSGNPVPATALAEETKLFTVQFNPSELSLSAKGEQVQKQSSAQRPGEPPVVESYTVEPPVYQPAPKPNKIIRYGPRLRDYWRYYRTGIPDWSPFSGAIFRLPAPSKVWTRSIPCSPYPAAPSAERYLCRLYRAAPMKPWSAGRMITKKRLEAAWRT